MTCALSPTSPDFFTQELPAQSELHLGRNEAGSWPGEAARVQSPSGQMRRRPRGTGVAQARQNSVQKVRHSQTLLSGPLAGLASGFSSALAEGPNRPVWRKQRAEGTLV